MAYRTNFIATVLGDPNSRIITILKSHAPYNITLPDFNKITERLGEALIDANCSEINISTILKLISNLMDQIVSNK